MHGNLYFFVKTSKYTYITIKNMSKSILNVVILIALK